MINNWLASCLLIKFNLTFISGDRTLGNRIKSHFLRRRYVRKILFVANSYNLVWIWLQLAVIAVRKPKITQFFVTCATTIFVPKHAILPSILGRGKNINAG
jgi:hypothetical protein